LGDISGDLSANIGQFIGWYFKYRPFFCYKRYGERFLHIISAAGKKGDIGRYLGRLGRYLKHGAPNGQVGADLIGCVYLSSCSQGANLHALQLCSAIEGVMINSL